MIIETYNQLIKFITDNKLTPEQAGRFINLSLKVIFIKDYETTKEMIEVLNEFWKKWKHTREKPLIVDVDQETYNSLYFFFLNRKFEQFAIAIQSTLENVETYSQPKEAT